MDFEAVREPGRPLDVTVRSLMERGLGHDLGDVRVHTDSASTTRIGAAAYTFGSHVVFGPGRYAPETWTGRWLLAHELAHVAQQRGDSAVHTGQSEARADAAATRIAAGFRAAGGLGWAPAGVIQRSPLSDAVRDSLGANPSVEAVLARLGAADVQAAQSDPDLDRELEKLLAQRPNDLWLARRVWHGLREAPAKAGAPRKIEAVFVPGATDRRALVIAGVHGTERQGIEVAQMLLADLRTKQPQMTTIVVPSLFPDNAAKGRFGTRESGATQTNRNFPTPDKDLAASGGKDALGKAILPENLLLIELIERFKPERIISIHGTWDPAKAGVFYDPRALRPEEEQRAATARPRGRVNYTSEGEERATAELRAGLRTAPSTADRRLSLQAAAEIDRATSEIKGREGRVAKKSHKAHPSVAGNVGASGDLDFAFWGGEKPVGVSLGGYAPPRGISVFTVEPPVNRTTQDYKDRPSEVADKITAADRRIELQAYADAVRTILLGTP